MAAAVLLGTCGWSYQEWVGLFYPNNKVAKPEKLRQIFAPLSFKEWDAKENKYPRNDPTTYLQMLICGSHEPIALNQNDEFR